MHAQLMVQVQIYNMRTLLFTLIVSDQMSDK